MISVTDFSDAAVSAVDLGAEYAVQLKGIPVSTMDRIRDVDGAAQREAREAVPGDTGRATARHVTAVWRVEDVRRQGLMHNPYMAE